MMKSPHDHPEATRRMEEACAALRALGISVVVVWNHHRAEYDLKIMAPH